MSLDLVCTNEEKILVTLSPVTASGKPASIDGSVSVTVVSGDSTFDLVDDFSFYVVSSDVPGNTSYLIEADVDIGDGVTYISDTVNLVVNGALAKNLGMVASIPELK
jgi:uncharacterized lipoprotein YbaY